MAKAKKAKAAKAVKAKLPKTIGSVKIPKEMRKAGGKLLDKANSPAGREMIAGAAAALASAVLAGRSKTVSKAVAGEADAATEAGRQFAQAIGTMATDAIKRVFEKPSRG